MTNPGNLNGAVTDKHRRDLLINLFGTFNAERRVWILGFIGKLEVSEQFIREHPFGPLKKNVLGQLTELQKDHWLRFEDMKQRIEAI